MIQKLKELGFAGPYSGGRHLYMERNGFIIHVPNPHQGDISKNLVAQILREAEISENDWENA